MSADPNARHAMVAFTRGSPSEFGADTARPVAASDLTSTTASPASRAHGRDESTDTNKPIRRVEELQLTKKRVNEALAALYALIARPG